MTREELEEAIELSIKKWNHPEDYFICKNYVYEIIDIGIRYGFAKARDGKLLFESDEYGSEGYQAVKFKYESAEQVIQELE